MIENSDPYLEEQFDVLFETLVPDSGEPDTICGKIIKAYSILEYEYRIGGNYNTLIVNSRRIQPIFEGFLELISDNVPNSKKMVDAIRHIILYERNPAATQDEVYYALQNHITLFVIGQLKKEKIEYIIHEK